MASLSPRQMLRVCISPLLNLRARRMARIVASELEAGDSVLDVGCGDLFIGREVRRLVGVDWVGLDTLDYNQTDLEIIEYNGKTLPFPEGSFTTVALLFVLHHCDDPIRVLGEACRVTNKRLIIMEDVPNGRWRMGLAKLHDFLANKLLEPGMSLPYQFKTQEEWVRIFHERGLEVAKVCSLKTQPLAFVNQMLFVLKK